MHRLLSTPNASMSLRRHQAVPLHQAAQESPVLSRLAELGQESRARLRAIESMIPPGMRSGVQAGPIEGNSWCLIVNGNAAAAKLRQLLPAFAAHLRTQGYAVQAIRLKVLTRALGSSGQ
jgi:hypothetical protein